MRAGRNAAQVRHHRLLVIATAALAAAAPASAATRDWLGLGSSASWSEVANWSAMLLPATGDDLVFGGSPPWLRSHIDLNLALRSLRFTADAAQFELRVGGSGGHALVFSGGPGIQNLTGGGGPLVQELIAESGAGGGSITFSGASGVNLGNTSDFRPVSISAAGASVADGVGAVGGRIVFEGTSTTGSGSFTALRAHGASVAGGGAGSLLFRESATTGSTGLLTVTGGSTNASVGASAHFVDDSQLQGGLAVLAGSGGGQGGRAHFTGRSGAMLNASIDNIGADHAAAGAEAVTRFADDTRLLANATNREATALGGSGGRLEFSDRALFDSSGRDPLLGSLQILNHGSDLWGARGGSLVFSGDSGTRGTLLVITNGVQGEGQVAGSAGGTTEFRDRAQAGRVQVFNEGARVGSFLGLPTTTGGQTSFHQQASAGQARFTSAGGHVSSALGGRLYFFDDSSAAGAVVFNDGALQGGAQGGLAVFSDRSTAAAARLINGGGQQAGAAGGQLVFNADADAGSAVVSNYAAVGGADGGRTVFAVRARAGTATIENATPLDPLGGRGVAGMTRFIGQASADRATLFNIGSWHSTTFDAGNTRFEDDSSAGDASIYNLGGRSAGASGGFTTFSQRASAGNALFLLRSGAAGAGGGVVEFLHASRAAQARFEVDGPSLPNGNGGALIFFDNADAGDAMMVLRGSQQAGLLGASATFTANASAGRAVVTVGGGGVDGARGARLDFGAGAGFVASAGQAAITNQSATAANAAGGSTQFGANSTAAAARIVNQGAAFDYALGAQGIGGTAVFHNSGNAGNAEIRNEGGSVVGAAGGSTLFSGTAGAGDATITNGGARGAGGTTLFGGNASAERSRIVNQAAAIDGAGFAGTTLFQGSSSAGSAQISAQGSANATRGAGLIDFSATSNGGNAYLHAEGASGADGYGGLLRLTGSADGGRARVVIDGGDAGRAPGRMDITGLSVAGSRIGSIEGGGVISLGSKLLLTGGNDRSTTFSGLIRDGGGGGRLAMVGSGTLTLTGANTYRGGTTVSDGLPGGSGKLVVANTEGSATGSGPVLVNRGGTLGGSGFIAGPVTLRPGGRIVPGDPVTLTLHDSLTWDGGGVIRLELGADSAGSDRLVVSELIRGDNLAAGFRFELVNLSAVVGQAYELVHFDRLSGFDGSDFSFDAAGVAGKFSLGAGGLMFTATALPVPEPGSAALVLAGLLVVAAQHRRRAGPAPHPHCPT